MIVRLCDLSEHNKWLSTYMDTLFNPHLLNKKLPLLKIPKKWKKRSKKKIAGLRFW